MITLTLKPTPQNVAPLHGIVIQSPNITVWITEIQQLGLKASLVEVYALPNPQTATFWGCVVVCPISETFNPRQHSLCQLVHNLLLIPEYSMPFPQLSAIQLNTLLSSTLHLLHPTLGCVVLKQPVSWKSLVVMPLPTALTYQEPAASLFIPKTVKSFQVSPITEEEFTEALKAQLNFTEEVEKPEDNPLTWKEKLKLRLYGTLFSKDETSKNTEKTDLLQGLEKLTSLFSSEKQWVDNAQKNYEELTQRNEKTIADLVEMLKKDPNHALKYAIPIDDGSFRGGENTSLAGAFSLSQYWKDFSLFDGINSSSSGKSGGTNTISDNSLVSLRQQYYVMARDFVERKEYHKAAFVYLKLLKEPYSAANALEQGKLYAEAALVYEKAGYKEKAAFCYEKANMLQKAIDYYESVKDYEKAGDLYVQLQLHAKAQQAYQLKLDAYLSQDMYVKAAILTKEKMLDTQQAQQLLLDGWRKDKDSLNCLGLYLSNIEEEQVAPTLTQWYQKEVKEHQEITFLTVLKNVFKTHSLAQEVCKEMAYQIIVSQSEVDKIILNELTAFNPNDTEMVKDITRYKTKK